MNIHTAHAKTVDFARMGGTIGAFDGSGAKIGQVDLVRGFAHYTGVAGGVHAGVTAVIRGGIDGLIAALATGIRNGRDDRA